MNIEYPKKLNYQDYEHAFNSYWLKKFVEGQLRDFDTETMRGLVYGYTFTEDYAKGIIPDELSVDYWKQKNKGVFSGFQRLTCAQLSLSEYLGQELLICEAIESTGKGTLDDPYCVICVGHEYEFLRTYRPAMRVVSQRLLPGHIDCLELEGLGGYTETLYFDISRWFERGKINDKEAKL
jgi:hypothetical protein